MAIKAIKPFLIFKSGATVSLNFLCHFSTVWFFRSCCTCEPREGALSTVRQTRSSALSTTTTTATTTTMATMTIGCGDEADRQKENQLANSSYRPLEVKTQQVATTYATCCKFHCELLSRRAVGCCILPAAPCSVFTCVWSSSCSSPILNLIKKFNYIFLGKSVDICQS